MVSEIVTAMERFDQNEEVSFHLSDWVRAVLFPQGPILMKCLNDDPIHLELLNQFADWDRICLNQKANYRCCKRICFWWRI